MASRSESSADVGNLPMKLVDVGGTVETNALETLEDALGIMDLPVICAAVGWTWFGFGMI